MKAIYLIRHAKSDSNHVDHHDFERPLSSEGIQDASLMANKLKELNFNPELILCSPSKRTKTTAEIIANTTGCLFDELIYEASLEYLNHLLSLLSNKYKNIALIGHNPSITLLSNYLTSDLIDYIPPCGVVKIELEIDDWDQIIEGIGIKRYFISPKDFV